MLLREKPATVRAAILQACERALATHGFRRMTMDDVAEEGKLARRTIYLHFANKEELVDATIISAIARTQAALAEPLKRGTGLESLREMLIGRIFVRLKHIGPFHHSIDEVNRALYPHSAEEDRTFYEPEVLLLKSAIEKGIADGSITVVDPRSVAEILLQASNGFLPSNLTRAEVADPKLVRARLGAFVDILFNGIAKREMP